MHFSTAELRHSFQASTLDRGGAYQQRGHVLMAEQNGDVIQGQVKTDGRRKRVAAPASAKLEAIMELVDEFDLLSIFSES